ncbi:MAG: transposase [Candidatus Dormibacteraeota bacterium]|uniref:Transposase n=2 Tax=Candidatus Dormiibacter inghamiae TaxID=3127013 RepID=A0A934KJ21_9BACT|nr:transposase [Candidatus Dormibacteraeota bacterium]MBJ7606148.1 transposase [Candidatus Dormibacteraeota bacterium]
MVIVQHADLMPVGQGRDQQIDRRQAVVPPLSKLALTLDRPVLNLRVNGRPVKREKLREELRVLLRIACRVAGFEEEVQAHDGVLSLDRIQPKGIGRCRMAQLVNVSAASTRPRRRSRRAKSDRHQRRLAESYQGIGGLGHAHQRRSQRAARARREAPGELCCCPPSNRVASPAKRWLLGTHQGSLNEAHLPAYLNEFVFRFNRRRFGSRGLVFYRVLELAACHDPVCYQDLIAAPRPHAVRRRRHGEEVTRPALIASLLAAHGGRIRRSNPVTWIPHRRRILDVLTTASLSLAKARDARRVSICQQQQVADGDLERVTRRRGDWAPIILQTIRD